MKGKGRFLFLVFTLVTVLLISSMTACTSKAPVASETPPPASESTEEPEDVTISAIYYGEANANDVFLQQLALAVDNFNAADNHVTVDWQWVAGQTYYDKLNALMAANSVPDVFVCHGAGKMQTYVDAGKTLALDEYIDSDSAWKDSFKSGIFNLCQFDGMTYGIPVNQTISAVFYNKEMFDQYSLTPPATWDEFLNVCKVLKENEIVPIALGAKDAWTIALFSAYISNRFGGGQPYDDIAAGGGDWTDPSFVKSGEMVKELMDLGYISNTSMGDSYEQSIALVTSGEAAMICMGSWVIGPLNSEGSTVIGKMDIFPFPEIEGGVGDKNLWLGQTDNFCISANTEHPEASISLLKWFTSDGFQVPQAELGGKLPVTNVTIDPAKAAEEFNLITAAMKDMSGMFIFYDVGLGAKIGDEYNNTMGSILAGSKTPEEAFADLQEYTENNR